MYITSFLCSLHSYFWDTVLHVNLTLYAVYDSNGNIVMTYWTFEVIFLCKPFCYVHANTSYQSRGRFNLCVVRQKFIDTLENRTVSIFRAKRIFSHHCQKLKSVTVLVISYRTFLVYYFTLRNNDHLLTENDDGIFHDFAKYNRAHPDCE